MKEGTHPFLGRSYLVSEEFFDDLKELRKQSINFNHAWKIINNRRYRKTFGFRFWRCGKTLLESMYYGEVDLDVRYHNGHLKHVKNHKA